MLARMALADQLVMKANTAVGAEKALEHYMGMVHLCRSDNMGVRDAVPGLLIGLDREQECY